DVVVGFGYDHNFLKEERHPTKEILNEVSTEHPIFISHTSGHVGCANDAALTKAGVDATTPDEERGVIGRIEGSNEPNGYLEEGRDRKSTRLNSSHVSISYAVYCLKKIKKMMLER